MQEA
jgi:hypothetical protein